MRNTSSTNPDDPSLHWSDAWLLGHDAMDATHREFVDLVSALHDADDALLPGLLEAFIAHAQEHFADEERWMLQSDFPATACHRDEHAAVLATVRTARRRLAEGDATLCRRVVAELMRWFPAHVERLDSALAQWLCKRRHDAVPLVLRRDVARGAGDARALAIAADSHGASEPA